MKRLGDTLGAAQHAAKKKKKKRLTRGYNDWRWERFATVYQAMAYYTGIPTELVQLIMCDLLRTYFTRELYLTLYTDGGGDGSQRLIAFTCDCSGGFHAVHARIKQHLARSGVRLERLRDYGVAVHPKKRWRLQEQQDLLLCLDEVPSETRLIVTFYGTCPEIESGDDDLLPLGSKLS